MKVYEEFIYDGFPRIKSQKIKVAVKTPSHRMQNDENKSCTQKWFCSIFGCEKKFQSAAHLSIHRSNKHLNDFPYYCRVCFIGYVDMRSCKRHELYCKVKRWECFLCHHVSSYRNYLKDHMNTHTGYKNFKCEICGDQYFTTSAHFKRHLRAKHLCIRNFQCAVCHCKFSRKQDLLKHQKAVSHFETQIGLK